MHCSIYFDVNWDRVRFMGRILLNSAKFAHLIDSCFVCRQLTYYWPSCCIGTQFNFVYAWCNANLVNTCVQFLQVDVCQAMAWSNYVDDVMMKFAGKCLCARDRHDSVDTSFFASLKCEAMKSYWWCIDQSSLNFKPIMHPSSRNWHSKLWAGHQRSY